MSLTSPPFHQSNPPQRRPNRQEKKKKQVLYRKLQESQQSQNRLCGRHRPCCYFEVNRVSVLDSNHNCIIIVMLKTFFALGVFFFVPTLSVSRIPQTTNPETSEATTGPTVSFRGDISCNASACRKLSVVSCQCRQKRPVQVVV